jgi:hypothetical protein
VVVRRAWNNLAVPRTVTAALPRLKALKAGILGLFGHFYFQQSETSPFFISPCQCSLLSAFRIKIDEEPATSDKS